ncbi:MAG: M23 family metallopeptidase [Bacteroidia bacterium]|nr:M23 family metallopeptidase [Bacteroidia bacterium]
MTADKTKYKFNTKTLMYEKVRVGFGQRILKVLSYVFIGVLFSVVSIYLSDYIFPSPGQKKLTRKLKNYEYHIQFLTDRINVMEKVLHELEERDRWVYRSLFEAEKASPPSVSDREKYKNYLLQSGGDEDEILNMLSERVADLMVRLQQQIKSLKEITELAKNKEELLQSIPAILPLDKNDLKRAVFSGYGWRTHPIYKTAEFHPGIDLTAVQGTPVYATGNGVVERADNLAQGYGNHVVIDHGYGYKTLYGHLSRFACKQGQKVKRGQLIGYVGSTGLSTAPHLHYEVIKNDEKVNPVMFFHADMARDQYLELIQKANQPSQSFD